MTGQNTGKIKWFSTEKGIGFIKHDNDRSDVFLHISDLKKSGYDSIANGTPVQFVMQATDRGPKATNLQVMSTEQVKNAPASQTVDLIEKPKGNPLSGKIKWFNRDRGYGFVACDNQDFFLHITAALRSGLTADDLLDGREIQFYKELNTKKGKEEISYLLLWEKKPQKSKSDQMTLLRVGERAIGRLHSNWKNCRDGGRWALIEVEGGVTDNGDVIETPNHTQIYLTDGDVSDPEFREVMKKGTEVLFRIRAGIATDKLAAEAVECPVYPGDLESSEEDMDTLMTSVVEEKVIFEPDQTGTDFVDVSNALEAL